MLPYERAPQSTREVLPSRVTCHSPHQGVAMPSVAQAAPQHSCLRCPRLKAGCVHGVPRSAIVFAGSTHNREARRQRQLAQLLIVRSGSRCPAPTRWQCGVAMAGAYEVEGCACAWVAAATQACGVVECAWRAEVSCRAQASRSLYPHTPRQDHTKRCRRPLQRRASCCRRAGTATATVATATAMSSKTSCGRALLARNEQKEKENRASRKKGKGNRAEERAATR